MIDTKKQKKEPKKRQVKEQQVETSTRLKSGLSSKDSAYLGSMKALVQALTERWMSAREISVELELSHQSPYNRIKKLKAMGFTVETREDDTLLRKVRRYRITKGDESLLEVNIQA